MERTLNVAVIGGGMFFEDVIGQSMLDLERGGIAPALTSIGMSHLAPDLADVRVRLLAVGTRSPASGTAGRICDWYRAELPNSQIRPFYGDEPWQQILKEDIDLLFVATPDHLHYRPIVDAIKRGVHVIAEKPMCLHTAEADEIVATSHEAGLVVAVDMHKRYDPFVRDMMTNARKKYARINRVRAVLEEPITVSTEVFKWVEQSNPFTYVGCHWLDVVAHYLEAFPAALYATGEKNLLQNWDRWVEEIARRQGRDPSGFARRDKIDAWDSLNVNVTYTDGMRGDYNNSWINPEEFEGAVNQEIEVYGILGRGFVDQQDRGFREAVVGDGSRTRNPTFAGRIRNAGGNLEVFGYGKASIVAGVLAIARRKFSGTALEELAGSYPDAASQRSVTMIIEAAAEVARLNYEHLHARGSAPVTARFEQDRIVIVDPYAQPAERTLYERNASR